MQKDPLQGVRYNSGSRGTIIQPLFREPEAVLLRIAERRVHPVLEWISLYQNGSSTTKIAKKYGVVASTVSRRLGRYIKLRERMAASIAASTRFPKTPFSGDKLEGAFLAGLAEDFHVRKAGRLMELRSATTHPAMGRLFHRTFEHYGHPTSRPGYDPRGYYRYHLSVYLHETFEPLLGKSENIPSWIPHSSHDPVFESYLAGLIAAEGCIRLYRANDRAHAVLHITLKKPKLLSELSKITKARLYEVQRAWRLVIYGKAAVELLRRLDIRHEEKVEKAKLVMDHAGERWSNLEPLWQETVNQIRLQVKQYKAEARLDFVQRHGLPHPAETGLLGR